MAPLGEFLEGLFSFSTDLTSLILFLSIHAVREKPLRYCEVSRVSAHCRATRERCISRNLKLGGMDKCLGGANMREAKIYFKKQKKTEKIQKSGGGCCF